MTDKPLSDEVDELLWSRLAEHPLTERLWQSGDTPIEIDPTELLTLTRAFNQGVRDALLRLAEEVEQLQVRQ